MNIFEVARLRLEQEGKGEGYKMSELLDRAIKIRKYLDKQDDKKVKTQFKKG